MNFAERIAEHERRDRLLPVFAPDETDARFAAQKKLLAGEERGFEERDLVPLYFIEDIETREAFDVEEGSFAAILMGKDGGEKHRFERPVEVFRRIDEMPMLRREMEESS